MELLSRCLNLGCGFDIKPSKDGVEWTNLDMTPGEGVDIVANLESGLPFEDGRFDIILASHVLEHVTNYLPLVKECHRCLKPGGTLVVKVPEFPCRAAVADPTHIRYFVPESFMHFLDHDMGYDTAGLKGLFILAWLESIKHDRPKIDRGEVGNYFTELHVELVKSGGETDATLAA